MNGLIMKDRSVSKIALALFWSSLIALSCAGLSGCSGGGLSGDDEDPDPATVEYPIAYIQRPTPDSSTTVEDDLQDPFAFNPGAKLFVRSRADMNAEEINITDALVAPGEVNLYDVKDLAVSPDGENLVFAFHKPLIPNADPIDQTGWDIYVYNFSTKVVRPVIPNKNKSEGSDVAPHYLDDTRIVFVSDRQVKTKAVLSSLGSPAYSGLNERNNSGKAGVLHIMNSDGSNIDQLSFNQSHDLSPSQLRNGKLVFVRWDNMSGGNEGRMNLYTLNPSGMNLSHLYGYNSHTNTANPTSPLQFSKPREMEDGRMITILRETTSTTFGGDLVAIDTNRFSDNTQPTWENGSVAGPAQQSLAANPVHTDGTLSPGGEFGAVWPLFDGTGRLLISWSQCRYLDSNSVIRPCLSDTPSNATPAPLLYGIWIFDPDAQTQRPVVTPKEGIIYTDIVAASPAKNIATATDNTPGANTNDFTDYGNNIISTLATNNTAILDIRSVYNLDGGVGNFGSTVPANMISNQANPANAAYQTRTARFLQIVQGVPLPDEDDEIPAGNNQILDVPNFAFGQGRVLRHIIGYVPIEADGSVAVQVPANVPITFNILDANAQRLPNGGNHQVWWQFRAGEVVRCTGCHSTTSPNTTLTHGRMDSNAPDSNPGITASGRFAGVSVNDVNFDGSSNHVGQSMAQVYAFNKQTPRLPSLNAYFEDEWATNVGQRNPTLDYRYITADSARPRQVPVTPVTSESCLENPLTPLVPRWNISCRIIINYLEHVQPIWDKSRLFDANTGVAFADGDKKCTNCHAPVDAMGAAQVPAGQLDLTNSASDRDADRVMSRSELFTADTEQVLMGGAVVDVPDDIIDNGDGTVTTVVHTVSATMSTAGARNSARFFGCFDSNIATACGFTNTASTSHAGYLTKGELRLLSEWLDNGAQYYNDVAKAAAAQ
ncbi:MAG: hypothetical protein QM709_06685 [Spongiibacteraceae bacterium]